MSNPLILLYILLKSVRCSKVLSHEPIHFGFRKNEPNLTLIVRVGWVGVVGSVKENKKKKKSVKKNLGRKGGKVGS